MSSNQSKIHSGLIALGANLATPKSSFDMAVLQLKAAGIDVTSKSSLWQSPAWPSGCGHPDYINAVVSVSSKLTAPAVLSVLMTIEASAGRIRSDRNAPRPLDLDIIDWSGQVLSTPTLTLPHPRMQDRGFVLLPLAEIAEAWEHPDLGLNTIALLARLPTSEINAMHYAGRW